MSNLGHPNAETPASPLQSVGDSPSTMGERLAVPSNPRSNSDVVDPSKPAEEIVARASVLEITSHVGPMPPPELLEAYRAISPDLPDRMMKMAERAQEHIQALDLRQLDVANAEMEHGWQVVRRGQICGVVIAVAALVTAVGIFFISPHAAGAIVSTIFGGGGIGTLIWAFRYDRSLDGSASLEIQSKPEAPKESQAKPTRH